MIQINDDEHEQILNNFGMELDEIPYYEVIDFLKDIREAV